jgi:hypothetical protein
MQQMVCVVHFSWLSAGQLTVIKIFLLTLVSFRRQLHRKCFKSTDFINTVYLVFKQCHCTYTWHLCYLSVTCYEIEYWFTDSVFKSGCRQKLLFASVFGRFRKIMKIELLASSCLCVHPSVRPHRTRLPNGSPFMKFEIWIFFENLSRKLTLWRRNFF